MFADVARRLVFSWSWDTRCRNTDVARILNAMAGRNTRVLDAGCGEIGLSRFVASKSFVGLDVVQTGTRPGFPFVSGSIVNLPFEDRSFAITVSVDVLEHLNQSVRVRAITELMRVANDAVIIAFPSGREARQMDEELSRRLEASNKPIPDWLSEHLQNPYPEPAEVVAAVEAKAGEMGRSVRTSISFSEHPSIGRFLRWAAVANRFLYVGSNVAAGLLMPLLPSARRDRAYRSIILIEFDE